MVTEARVDGISPSPFSVWKEGKIDEGLTGLTHLMRGSGIHRLVLDLYNFEQESDVTRQLSSAQMAKLRLIKMKAYERIEDDLKQRGVVLDYPPRPEDAEDRSHEEYLESLWRVLEKIPKAVIVAGLKETVIVLPQGKRRLPHTREGFLKNLIKQD